MPTASINATIPSLTFGPGPKHRTYLAAAQALLPGAKALATANAKRDDAFILVAGFIAEALLKAILSHAGVAQRTLQSRPLAHDLVALWEKAVSSACPLGLAPPAWLEQLNIFHKGPVFFIRYQQGGGAYSLPRVSEILGDLDRLHSAVKSAVLP